MVGLDVVGHVTLAALHGLEDEGHLLALLLDLDDVTDAHAVARDVDALAVHRDVAVAHELAGREGGRHELGAVDDGVEAALEKADQVLGGRALHAAGFLVHAAELTLGNVAVVALELLLGAELLAVVGELALAALAVLAGTGFTLVERALGPAPDVLAEAAIDLVLGADALGHLGTPEAAWPGLEHPSFAYGGGRGRQTRRLTTGTSRVCVDDGLG